MSFEPISPSLFFTRHDPGDPRLGECVQGQDPQTARWILVGYPDDQGVLANKGRPGASEGPDVIRKYLYNMTPPAYRAATHELKIADAGNLAVGKIPALEKRHEVARSHIFETLSSGRRVICLGGGHDYGFPDAAGFLDWCRQTNQRGVVINFDAHLDVREADQKFHSGTPFRRLLNEFSDCEFYEIGIQGQCNSRDHLEWARAHGAKILMWEELELAGESLVSARVLEFLNTLLVKPRPTFLSVDLDAFALPLSAGTSAPTVTGFTAQNFLPIWETLRAKLDVRGAGFYEHSPTHDPGHVTARLAALLVHRLIACSPSA